MEKGTNYIEGFIKNISEDKNRLFSLVFSTLSAICTVLYITSVGVSGIHFIFVLAMLVLSVANIAYAVDTTGKIKHMNDILVCAVAVMLIGLILKVFKVGISFSVVYFIGYLVYALTFLMIGLHLTRKEIKPTLIKILLIVCAIWSLYEFIVLNSIIAVGIIWKFFRLSEMFLVIGQIFLLNLIDKDEIPFADKLGEYKSQVPSAKICVIIVLAIAVLSAGIGFVFEMNRNAKSNVTTTSTVTENADKKVEKKSTVSSGDDSETKSTVVSDDQTTKEDIKEVKIGDTIETDSYSLKLNKVEISRRVEPASPPSYYTYYQAEDNHTYVYVNASVTNKEKHALECDEIYSVTVDFDGGYEYKGFNIADDTDGDFTYANITSVEPLATRGVHCLVDCPQVIEEEGKPLFITIDLKNGEKYKYIIR